MTPEQEEIGKITIDVSRALSKAGVKEIMYDGDDVHFFYKGYRIDLLIKKDIHPYMQGGDPKKKRKK